MGSPIKSSVPISFAFNFDNDKPIKVIYNGSNLDSFLAAFIVWLEKCDQGVTNSDLDFFNADRGAVPSNIYNKQLLCLGFTYKSQTLHTLLKTVSKILIVDNYSFDTPNSLYLNKPVAYDYKHKIIKNEHLDIVNKSSSYIVWQSLNPNMPIHPLVEYVQDRELFQFKLNNTREVIASLLSYPLDFGVWNELFNMPVTSIIKDGIVIRRYQGELNKHIIKTANRVNFLEYTDIPVVNCPWFLTSEVLSTLAQTNLFSLGYYDKYNKRHFSLRSTVKSGFNVQSIAEKLGGGGHFNAAGFTGDIESHNMLFGNIFAD